MVSGQSFSSPSKIRWKLVQQINDNWFDMWVYKSHPSTYQQLKGVYKSHPSLKDGYYPIDTAWLIHPQLPHHPPSTQRLDQGVGHETARWTRKTLQVGGYFWTCGSFTPKIWWKMLGLKIWTDALQPSESSFSVSWRYHQYSLMNFGRLTWSARICGWDQSMVNGFVFVKGWFSICAYLCHIIRWQSLSFEEDLQG